MGSDLKYLIGLYNCNTYTQRDTETHTHTYTEGEGTRHIYNTYTKREIKRVRGKERE